MLKRLRRAAGLDFHVLTTLVLRTWQILAGAVMVLFVPYWLSKVEQGYYFTFSSLIALTIFFEMLSTYGFTGPPQGRGTPCQRWGGRGCPGGGRDRARGPLPRPRRSASR
jgi:hypothetical protein